MVGWAAHITPPFLIQEVLVFTPLDFILYIVGLLGSISLGFYLFLNADRIGGMLIWLSGAGIIFLDGGWLVVYIYFLMYIWLKAESDYRYRRIRREVDEIANTYISNLRRNRSLTFKTLPQCKTCRYYHGNNNIHCSNHPYGPTNDECSDYKE